jgi:exopolysaccharide production protein ExoQ
MGKNSLGSDCMIFGLFFLWHFLRTWRAPRDAIRRNELRLILLLAVMLAWLMYNAHSATSLVSFLVGAALILLLGQQWVNKRLLGTYVILAVVASIAADAAFGAFDLIVDLTGHGATLIGRQQLWHDLLALHTNPLIGVGFESFWLGDWTSLLPEGRAWIPNEAHNGYLETYLNLGLIGLFLLIGLLVATFRKAGAELLSNLMWGRLRFGFLITTIFANWTESKFRGLSVLWFAFYIIAIDYPKLAYESSEERDATIDLSQDLEPAYVSHGIQHRSDGHSIG